jgi:hypothetical protein
MAKQCLNCGKPFSARQYNQQFCAEPCRHSWHSKEKSAALALYRALQQTQCADHAAEDAEERAA